MGLHRNAARAAWAALVLLAPAAAQATTLDFLPDSPVASADIVAPSLFSGSLASVTGPAPLPDTSSIPQREAFGTFDIQVNYTGDAAFLPAFQAAEAFWESQIVGYAVELVADFLAVNNPQLMIDASVEDIDGAGMTLGRAGATTTVELRDLDGNLVQALPTAGIMEFDSSDIVALSEGGTFEAVIIHEMAHVMGFSDFFWDVVGATDGSGSDTSYTGAIALALYQEEFDPDATFIPLEESGGEGTAFAHWDEELFGDFSAQNGGASNNPEIMTGFLDANPYLSLTTLGAFDDIGYVTVATLRTAAVVPLPAGGWLLLAGLGGIVAFGRRRRRI